MVSPKTHSGFLCVYDGRTPNLSTKKYLKFGGKDLSCHGSCSEKHMLMTRLPKRRGRRMATGERTWEVT